MCLTVSDEDFPVRQKKHFTGKKGVELRKNQLKANQAGKRKNTSRKYISSEGVKRLKGSRKDCKMIFQASCEEKKRTDKSLSLFPLQEK